MQNAAVGCTTQAAELGACANVTCNACKRAPWVFKEIEDAMREQRKSNADDAMVSNLAIKFDLHQAHCARVGCQNAASAALLEKPKDQCRANEGSAGQEMGSLAVGDWKMKWIPKHTRGSTR